MSAAYSLQTQAMLVYQAFDRSDDIVILIESSDATDPVVAGANGAFRRATGYAEDELIGRAVAEFFPLAAEAEQLIDAILTRSSLKGEFTCARARGDVFVLGLHLMPAPSPPNGHACMALLGRDITQVLEARRKQEAIQALLAQVFATIEQAVAIVDDHGRMLLTNPGLSELLGYPHGALVGQSTLEFVTPRARARMAKIRDDALARDGRATYTAPLLKADGSEMLAQITSIVVEREALRKYRILTIRPITEPDETMKIAGQIKLVGLDEVRAALGARWASAAERAMATAESIISRRCGPSDAYSRIDGTSFLVNFGELSESEASLRIATIGREIRETLIGTGHDTAASRVRAVAAAVSVPSLRDLAADSLRAALLDGLNGQLARVERQARHTLRAIVANPTPYSERVVGRNPETSIATLVRLPDELERDVVCALSVLPETETDRFDLDGLLLGMAAHEAVAGMVRGSDHPVLATVSFDVFRTRAATERYTELCARLDARVCARLILLLSGVPHGLPETRLLEWINRLRPFCRGMGFQAEAIESPMEFNLTHCPNPIVALPAAPMPTHTASNLRRQIDSLHARRATVLVRRVLSEEDAAVYLSMGADMISMALPARAPSRHGPA